MSKWPGKTKHADDCISVLSGRRQGDGTGPCTCGVELTDEQRRLEILTLAKQFDDPGEAIMTLCAAIAVCATLSDAITSEGDMLTAMREINQTQVGLAIDCFRECQPKVTQ